MNRRAQAGVLAAICVAFLGHAWLLHFTADDAYISFRYAQNWAEGHGCVYNVGERVEGYTNFAWVLLLALLRLVGLDMEFCAVMLGLTSGVLLLVCVGRFVFVPGPRWRSLVAAAMLAAFGPLAAWAGAGLETALFTVLTFAAVVSFIKGLQASRFGFSTGILLALAMLIRPDGIVTCGGLLLAATVLDPGRLVSVWRPVLSFAVIYVPYFLWRWAYYDLLLPNTYYVKVATVSDLGQGRRYLAAFLRDYPFTLLAVLPMCMAAWSLGRRSSARPDCAVTVCFAAVTLLYLGYVVRTDGDWMPFYRRLVPVLPFVVCMVAMGLSSLNALAMGGGSALASRAWLVARVLAWVLVAENLVVPSLTEAMGVRAPRPGGHCLATMRELSDAGRRVGRWLKSNAWPQDSVATRAAGALAYFSGLRIVDFHGLTDSYLSRHGKVNPTDWPGHKITASREYILSKEPTFIIEHPQVSRRGPHKVTPSPEYPGYVSATFRGTQPGDFIGVIMRGKDFRERVVREPDSLALSPWKGGQLP